MIEKFCSITQKINARVEILEIFQRLYLFYVKLNAPSNVIRFDNMT